MKEHPFVALVAQRLEWLRELYKKKVPWGLIHGDAFLDNTMFEACASTFLLLLDAQEGDDCKILALIDWEDLFQVLHELIRPRTPIQNRLGKEV